MLGNNSGHIAELPTVVWNQAFERNIEVPFNIDNTNGSSKHYATIGGSSKCPYLNTLTLSHKYYINIHPTFDEGSDVYTSFYVSENQYIPLNAGSRIWVCNNSSRGDLRIAGLPVGKHIYGKMTCHLIDLTQMFGAGNEPTSVAQFEQWFTDNIGSLDNYYPYNTGEEIKVKYLPQYM